MSPSALAARGRAAVLLNGFTDSPEHTPPPGPAAQPCVSPQQSMPRRKAVPTLGSLCLQSLVQHMQSVWVKDYSENYLDEYSFRFVMGPFNDLGELRGARGGRQAGRRCCLLTLITRSRQFGAGPDPAAGREPPPVACCAASPAAASPAGAQPAALPRPGQQCHRAAHHRALQGERGWVWAGGACCGAGLHGQGVPAVGLRAEPVGVAWGRVWQLLWDIKEGTRGTGLHWFSPPSTAWAQGRLLHRGHGPGAAGSRAAVGLGECRRRRRPC